MITKLANTVLEGDRIVKVNPNNNHRKTISVWFKGIGVFVDSTLHAPASEFLNQLANTFGVQASELDSVYFLPVSLDFLTLDSLPERLLRAGAVRHHSKMNHVMKSLHYESFENPKWPRKSVNGVCYRSVPTGCTDPYYAKEPCTCDHCQTEPTQP